MNKKHLYIFFSIALIALILFHVRHVSAEVVDSDGDGVSDTDETTIYHTDPMNHDTDGDGYLDNEEINNGYSPLVGERKKMNEVDSDKDGLNDAWEVALHTNLTKADTDNDGYSDGEEVTNSFSPIDVQPTRVEKVITVSLASQRLVYTFDGIQLDSFLISSGVKSMPTPKGSFVVLDKVPVKHYGGANFDYPNTKWNLHFTTKQYRYYIHGAYWHTNFGKPMSHGCVNVSYKNMEPLYAWAQVGTKVVIQ